MNIIGIDLGTSNSAAAVLRGGRPVIIPSAEGVSIGVKAFPSYVALTADGRTLVGELARRQATTNPEGTATAFKRKMGQRIKVRLRNKEFTPEQLSAFLLQKIKSDAEAFLGEQVQKAVVTVPASLWKPSGCEACAGTGFDGRVGIFEVWRLTTEGRTLILHRADEPTLNRHVLATGTRTLLLDALDKIASGLTTLSEIRPLYRQGMTAVAAP